MSLVTQELTSVSEMWQYIGEELGVHQSSLRHISTKHSDSGDCLREVLRERLRRCATTWKHIVDVLRTPRIGESHLADHLEAKYCSCELAYSPVNVSIINLMHLKLSTVQGHNCSAKSSWSLKATYKYANFCD